MKKNIAEKIILISLASLAIVGFARNIIAQTSEGVLYIPLIGITAVPEPSALPDEGGDVTYKYAVKNFVKEVPLTDIQVVDDKCLSVKFLGGDDNGDFRLDYDEIWRYSCTAKLSTTTQSVSTVTGIANNINATHNAHVTVVVGSGDPPPLVSIINITKVAYPVNLFTGGGNITFTYRVSNPGVVPLSDVVVNDDKCRTMSGKLGDTNSNDLLDAEEAWVYSCTMRINQTTTNTASVSAYANGFKTVGYATITVPVKDPIPGFQTQALPNFPDTGAPLNIKIIVWAVMEAVFVILVIVYIFGKKGKSENDKKGPNIVGEDIQQ